MECTKKYKKHKSCNIFVLCSYCLSSSIDEAQAEVVFLYQVELLERSVQNVLTLQPTL